MWLAGRNGKYFHFTKKVPDDKTNPNGSVLLLLLGMRGRSWREQAKWKQSIDM